MNLPYLRIWTGHEYVEVTSLVFMRETKQGIKYGEPYNPCYKKSIRSFRLPSLELIGTQIDLQHFEVEFYDCIECKDRIVVNYKVFEDGEHVAYLHLTRRDGSCTRKVVAVDRLHQQRNTLARAG